MSNESTGNTRTKFRVYLIYFTLHALAFLALSMIRAAVHHPVILENPFTLFASLVSMFYTSTLISNQLHTAYHNLVTNYRIYLDHDQPQTPGHYGLFAIKFLSSAAANTVLLFWTAFVLTYPTVNAVSVSVGLLSYHVLTLIRDYCSSCYAFDFVDRYFGVTMISNKNTYEQSWSNQDDAAYHFIASSRNIDLNNRPELCCGLQTIIPKLYSEQPSVMYRPLMLKHKRTQAVIWAESDTAIAHIDQLGDYTIHKHHQPACQQKIGEIRQYFASMTQRMQEFKLAQTHLRTVVTDEQFKNYMQAISSTEDTPLPDPLPNSQKMQPQLAHDLNQQRNHLLTYFNNGPVLLDTHQPTLSAGASPDYCAITGNAVTIPIIVRLTHVDPSRTQNDQTFYCDLYSLIHWLDDDPNSYLSSEQVDMDKSVIHQIICDTPSMDKMTRDKLQSIQAKITDNRPSNPIGLLISMYDGPSTERAIEALLTSAHMRQRVHAPDLMKSISKGSLSLSEYLTSRGMDKLHSTLIRCAYTPPVSSYRSTTGHIAEQSGDDLLLHKRWPMGRSILLSPDVKVSFSLDKNMLDSKHQHMLNVINHVLKPQAEQIKSKLNDTQTYYIHSPEQACTSVGREVSVSSLLEMGLFQDSARITTTPLTRNHLHRGLRLFSEEQTSQTPSPDTQKESLTRSTVSYALRPTTLFNDF